MFKKPKATKVELYGALQEWRKTHGVGYANILADHIEAITDFSEFVKEEIENEKK